MNDYDAMEQAKREAEFKYQLDQQAAAQKASAYDRQKQTGSMIGGYASANQAKPAVLSITLQELGERLQKLAGLSADMADRVRGPQAENMLADSLVGGPEAGDLNSVASRLLRTVDRIERNTMRALNAL